MPMHANDYITLGEAAKLAPGRPSANCIWRWCRKGVLSRAGQRVRLRHVRIGGKIFTKAEWLNEFGQSLAAADAEVGPLQDLDRSLAVGIGFHEAARLENPVAGGRVLR